MKTNAARLLEFFQEPGTLQARVTRALRALHRCVAARTGDKL